MSQQKVIVQILGKEYQFAASDTERAALLTAADQLDSTMRSIKGNNTTLSADKVAIMAALNISHELMQLKHAHQKVNKLKKDLQNAIKVL
ncbi:Z-ring-associated protein ZapA [hydrothermal vent metagenome]|uniref:Cell division protein ZapA n=1 Tax=hydrothermal vent metagenome TaxID=652676 RepID=A0A3B0V0L8_9ZZZZ